MCKEKHHKNSCSRHFLTYSDLVWDSECLAHLELPNGYYLWVKLNEKHQLESIEIKDGYDPWIASGYVENILPDTYELHNSLLRAADTMFICDVIRMTQERIGEVEAYLKKERRRLEEEVG